jgi:hypothetical protein
MISDLIRPLVLGIAALIPLFGNERDTTCQNFVPNVNCAKPT